MNIVIPNAGAIWYMTWAIQSTSTPENLTLRLYTNDYTPQLTDTVSSYSEASFSGYSAVVLSRSSWGTPTIVNGAAVSVYGTTPTFTCTGGSPQTIFGYFAVGGTHTTTVMFAGRFDAPFTITSGTAFPCPLTFGAKNTGVTS